MDHVSQTPLADRARPKLAEELQGQALIWAPGKPLFELAKKDAFFSLIFWGPPGVGKTSLARLISKQVDRKIIELSAVQTGVKELREVLDESKSLYVGGKKCLMVFLDEIHRLNKSQQDVLLPALEAGWIRFIGATTENPSFEVNRAILSRSLCFRFQSLAQEALEKVLTQALNSWNSWEQSSWSLHPKSQQMIAQSAGGDARKALNLLEAILRARTPEKPPEISVKDLDDFDAFLGARYDKKGEDHYDIISAFIKSVRASHPDAALHYLARMINAGEDPIFIARRLVILASEDVGNANPTALLVAVAALTAVQNIGMPEGRIPLAQATTYLAASPKSNRAYVAIDEALADVKTFGALDVPLHLRNAPTQLMKQENFGKDYVYAHSDLDRARQLTYLPPELNGRQYYKPSDHGAEKVLKDILAKLKPIESH